ncbi:MAG TPA: TrbG/VirB9 family P-type conjugative transfer protein [Sphingobium sp.]
MIAALLMLLTAGAVSAQVDPIPSDDRRIGVVAYAPGQPIRLRPPSDGELTLLFAPGERIRSIVASDPGVYHVRVSEAEDGLFIRVVRAGESSRLTVQTDLRLYDLLLVPADRTATPYLVRFSYPAPPFGAAPVPTADGFPPVPSTPVPSSLAPMPPGEYKLSGNRELLPSAMSDDGTKTYIEWPATQPLPAVFSVDQLGREEMVEGYMRNGLFTIDRVYGTLKFRIDKAYATASRRVAKAGR